MKHIYLLAISLFYSLLAFGQDFTIAQGTTGMTQNIFGQAFTPSIQGDGTGTVPSQSLVDLKEFSFMLDASETPEVLYIYEVLPENKEVLMDGSGGTLIGQSKSRTEESYWYTNYQFEGIVLDKDKMYYALFREAISCEVGMGEYEGGNIYRLGNDGTMNTTEYVNARFTATFSPSSSTDLTKEVISEIRVFPNITEGDVTVSSESPAVIDVFSITGVKTKTFKISGGKNLVNIADLPKGIYIFVCENDQISKVVKK